MAVAAGVEPAAAAGAFAWKSEFTQSSSPQLIELHEMVHGSKEQSLTSYPIQGEVWSEPDFELRLESGTLYLEPPLQGRVVGGFFEGKATVTFKPPDATGATALQMHFGRPAFENLPVKTAYIFSLKPDSLLARFSGAAGVAGTPAGRDVYLDDKSAMRQLGLRLTELFLNRDGAAKDATLVLIPMEEIRTAHNAEARLLYARDPMDELDISLSVFGHEEMSEYKPLKFKFHPLVEHASGTWSAGLADVKSSKVVLAPSKSKPRSDEVATLKMDVSEEARALRFYLSIVMEVSGIQDGAGTTMPYLQWKRLTNDPDFDQTVLVSVEGAQRGAGGEMELAFTSSGVLFEPWGTSFYLVDEDAWAPKLGLAEDDMQHELDVTIPSTMEGIGIGQRILEEKKAPFKRVVYRTTQPISISTLYFGDYNRTEGQADDLAIELYQRKGHLGKNAKYTLTEVSNAIKVFNRMFVPLDFKQLRVTDTPMNHGRGFEGLLLLGGGGTSEADSWTDLFRAHEVAHQWWFNMLRPRDGLGRDRWLSEAFAEYSALEYYKVRFEDSERTQMLMKEKWYDPLTQGHVTQESLTGEKQQLTGRTMYPLAAGTQNVYTKGPLVIGMLRYQLQVLKGSDDAWLPMLRDFLTTYKYKRASTEDFRAIAEKHAGVKLDWFFEQWFEDGGIPVVYWEQSIEEKEGAWILNLKARQEQKSYKLLIPVYLKFPGDKMAVRPWLIEGAEGTKSLKLPAKPSSVSLNDRLEALVILKALNR